MATPRTKATADQPPVDPSSNVRVRDKLTGHEYTTVRSVAEGEPGRYTILNKPTVDRQGVPLPPKPRILNPTSPDDEPDETAAPATDNA